MTSSIAFLIPLGLALFILRTQLLRVAIREFGMENLHASPVLGALSGWASLAGALVLAVLAIVYNGVLWGVLVIAIGLALGVVASALFLPMLGNTLAMGHHGGEGDKSVATFNRRYGHWVAFAVAGMAMVGLAGLFSFSI